MPIFVHLDRLLSSIRTPQICFFIGPCNESIFLQAEAETYPDYFLDLFDILDLTFASLSSVCLPTTTKACRDKVVLLLHSNIISSLILFLNKPL